MSHVTQEQAKRLSEMGFQDEAEGWWHELDDGSFSLENSRYGSIRGKATISIHAAPSAEELMEWLKDKIMLSVWYSQGKWIVDSKDPFEYRRIGHDEEIASALFQAARWVLEGKK